MKYYLSYEPQFKAFSIEDAYVFALEQEFEIPHLELYEKGYQMIGCSVPSPDAPTVGFLLGRNLHYYSAGKNYVLALAKAGLNIRFLTYPHCEKQLQDCQGLFLPGGNFPSPESYYTDSRKKIAVGRKVTFPGVRSRAYDECIQQALNLEIPILGVCAGAQMVAGRFGLKMYRNQDYIETPLKHNIPKAEAHRLQVFPDTVLSRILQGRNGMYVNSRHHELLAPVRMQKELLATRRHTTIDKVQLPLEIYAEANDGVPEAWGSEEEHILCVQWHPEDMVANGDELMQGIFRWLALEMCQVK